MVEPWVPLNPIVPPTDSMGSSLHDSVVGRIPLPRVGSCRVFAGMIGSFVEPSTYSIIEEQRSSGMIATSSLTVKSVLFTSVPVQITTEYLETTTMTGCNTMWLECRTIIHLCVPGSMGERYSQIRKTSICFLTMKSAKESTAQQRQDACP